MIAAAANFRLGLGEVASWQVDVDAGLRLGA
jgi:hypothetical protein